MLIGVDFDNTIVSYDELFCMVAKEQGHLPADRSANKTQLRDRLRAEGREDVWTAMQGYVYGERMRDAKPFPGVLEFFSFSRSSRIPVAIISHRTRYPYKGPRHDLHAAAMQWLQENMVTGDGQALFHKDRVFLEISKGDKMKRIVQQGCTHFIDDLPEFLLDVEFPLKVNRVLFDPDNCHASSPHFRHARSWEEIRAIVSGLRDCKLPGTIRRSA